ncbi:hypothetical protein LPJ59_000607 [Coemansia sp. RSA 2399]|nr:hypothetical protein LPJ59_000607 [Coemansia sp. RSA 2399]KAJ1907880.1 hypothetical protein LPJ81_000467 [Coemansia sp. IMI 209127]
MAPGRKRRRDESPEDASLPLQPYSQCSASAQSRRRTQLHNTIAQLSGGQATNERVLLVSETLSKADRAVHEGIIDTTPLRAIMANIRTMHDAAPPEQRTAVLALVAGSFPGPELKQKWGFSFGTHQLQAAKRMGSDGSFANNLFESHKRAMPPSRQPKPSDFVERLVQYVGEHTKDGSDTVLARPLRALHRDFVNKTADNKVSFSTFRALVLERFRLPGTDETAKDAEIENEGDTEKQQQEQQQQGENPYDYTQPLSMNQGLEGLISSLDFSSLGVDTMYYRQQPANLSLPSLQSLTAGVVQPPQVLPSASRLSEIPTIQNLFDLASFNNSNNNNQQQHQQQLQQQQLQQQQQQHPDSDEERFQSSQFFYF